jgi:diguanylate cyclase (GGDEF)-like protein/PAS domain S-box-containing protein
MCQMVPFQNARIAKPFASRDRDRFTLKYRETLYFRVLATVITLCAVAVATLSALYLERQNRFLYQQISSRADSIAVYLASQVEYPITTGDAYSVQSAAYHAFSNGDILFVTVRDASGKEIVSVKRPEFMASVPPPAGVASRPDSAANEFHLPAFIEASRKIGAEENSQPGENPGIGLGTVRIGYSTRQLATFRRESLEQSAMLAAAMIAVLFGFMFFRFRALLAPLRGLIRFIDEAGQGDLTRRAPVVRLDEVGLLATAFNSMLGDLGSTVVSRDYVDNILHSMAEALIVTDERGCIQTLNQAALKLTGFSETELIGQPLSVLMTDLALPVGDQSGTVLQSGERGMLSKSGAAIPVLVSYARLSGTGGDGMVCLAQDISEKKEAEQRLHAAQERYELAVRGANDGLWDWDLVTGEMYLSPRWKDMLGFAPEELANSPETWMDRLHPDDRARVQLELDDHIASRSAVFESENRILHNDGTYRWMLSRGIAVRTPGGKAKRMAGSQTDITGNKSSDPLTGLANRLLFTERLAQIMRDTRRGRSTDYAVLFLDVDRFKVVNDSLGHLAGDSLLRQIAERLKSCVRLTDTVSRLYGSATVARLGGDEFAILIERLNDPNAAGLIADRVLGEFARPFQLDGREIVSTFSVGVAVGTEDHLVPEDILRDADIAMYEAKTSGKARAQVFDPGMRTRAVDRMEMEGDIRTGIDRGEFIVAYQSKVELDTGEITGFEALVRWNHPTRGMLFPSDFIPIAEETGLIVPLGYWVLISACAQLKEWQTRSMNGNLNISVNISSRQFAEADLIERVATIVRESGIEPRTLDLELTETAVMQNPDAAAKTLRQLKALGIGLNMDDFGTGYSSLNYLQRFPFDTIKIDRSFVAGLGSRAENRELIRTIVDLAKNFNMKVVAEGVETQVQSAELRALGCHEGQGYLFSRPVSAPAAGELIAESYEVEEETSGELVCLL